MIDDIGYLVYQNKLILILIVNIRNSKESRITPSLPILEIILKSPRKSLKQSLNFIR